MRQQRRAANVRRLTQPTPSVEVSIDELVLHGFSAADRYSIGDALSLEIERRLAESNAHSFLSQDANLSLINAGRIALPPNAKPTWVGAQVGRTVFGSLMNSRPRSRR